MQAFSSSDATETISMMKMIESNKEVAVLVDSDSFVVECSVGGRKSNKVMSSEEEGEFKVAEEEEDDDDLVMVMTSSDEEEEEEDYADEEEEEEEGKYRAVAIEASSYTGSPHPPTPFLYPLLPTPHPLLLTSFPTYTEFQEFLQERRLLLGDAKNLKKVAAFFLHPEKPVETDGWAVARNYFARASAPEYDDDEERERILADALQLKKQAEFYLHPEQPLEVDPTVFGRNYYTRASAEDKETFYQAEQRNLILEEMKQMKKLAVDYLHPELPLATTDATAFGRNYYSRPSAPEYEDEDLDEERDLIHKDIAALKQSAQHYLHPELPLQVDSTCFGRNYFHRASAPDRESFYEAEQRALALHEMQQLKQYAKDYLHPEIPVTTTDPTACGRNYFTRPSAPEYYGDDDEEEEREAIMADLAALKNHAVDYLHPERPIEVDPTVFGRNYYSRPSAPEKESFYDAEQRALITAEMAELKKHAVDYLHPEQPLPPMDPTAFGRNYFYRFSAPEQEEDDEYADEREIILEEMAELKQAAEQYLHPEMAVKIDPTDYGRNYFQRPSAPEQESFEEAEERARILQEAAQLKKLAVDYMHPQLPVHTSDATACARNYFSRPSAPEQDDVEEAEERARILEEAAQLKKFAVDYMHPGMPMLTSDPTACARNYFSRASAPAQETYEEAEERSRILADAGALKKLAFDYFHPEVSVQTSDPTACARNYFGRASALGIAHYIHSIGYANHDDHHPHADADEQSHNNEYGHFDMDEDDMFHDMRQSIVLPGNSNTTSASKVQSNKVSSDEEGELSRSPSSVMLFTGALNVEDDHPRLPTMG